MCLLICFFFSKIWGTFLDRNQQRLALVSIPLNSFWAPAESSLQAVILLEETSNIWVNATSIPCFLEGSTPFDARFVWTSERSGFNHIELVHATCDPASGSKEVVATAGRWIFQFDPIYIYFVSHPVIFFFPYSC